MLPTIGLMIGFYIVARLVEMSDTNKPLLRALCLFGVIVNVIGMFLLWSGGSSVSSRLPY
jgi:Co/Zn/Cd efflux system component